MEICICFGIFCKLNLYEKKKREFTQYKLQSIATFLPEPVEGLIVARAHRNNSILLPKLW